MFPKYRVEVDQTVRNGIILKVIEWLDLFWAPVERAFSTWLCPRQRLLASLVSKLGGAVRPTDSCSQTFPSQSCFSRELPSIPSAQKSYARS